MQVGVHENMKGVIIHLVTFYCSKNSGQTRTCAQFPLDHMVTHSLLHESTQINTRACWHICVHDGTKIMRGIKHNT